MTTRSQQRRYAFEFLAAMGIYALVLVASLLALNAMPPDSAWRVPVSLLPVLPCVLALWVVVRQTRRMDELQMRVQFEAIGFAFAGTALLTFSYGFLENVGLPRLSMFFVWPVMAVLWMIGGQISARRYR